MAEIFNFSSVQYIRLTENIEFNILKGRDTFLKKDVPGFLLTEENIPYLIDVTDKQKKHCFDLLEEAKESERFAALIAGFPCIIGHNQFVKISPLRLYPVTGEII